MNMLKTGPSTRLNAPCAFCLGAAKSPLIGGRVPLSMFETRKTRRWEGHTATRHQFCSPPSSSSCKPLTRKSFQTSKVECRVERPQGCHISFFSEDLIGLLQPACRSGQRKWVIILLANWLPCYAGHLVTLCG